MPEAESDTTQQVSLVVGGTTVREYLSNPLTTPMKIICGAAFVFSTIGLLADLAQLHIKSIAILVIVGTFFAVFWVQAVVYIEGNELVVKRFWKEVRLRPDDIADVNFLGITKLLRLSFHCDTPLGRSVIFGPRTKLRLGEEPSVFDVVPTFERLGRFCGWKR